MEWRGRTVAAPLTPLSVLREIQQASNYSTFIPLHERAELVTDKWQRQKGAADIIITTLILTEAENWAMNIYFEAKLRGNLNK